jgi:hypothetical protein
LLFDATRTGEPAKESRPCRVDPITRRFGTRFAVPSINFRGHPTEQREEYTEPVRSRAMFDEVEDAPHSNEPLGSREQNAAQSAAGANPSLCQQHGWAPIFTSVLLFVGAVSFYDGYLVVRTGDEIVDFEKNPLGLYLLRIDNGSPDIFLRVKAAPENRSPRSLSRRVVSVTAA